MRSCRSAATSPTRRRSRRCSRPRREAFGRVDAVLNVAGIAGAQPLAEITMDEYDRIMAVDLQGVLLGTKHGIKAMLPTGGGVIVNWSSIGGMNGSAMPTSVYSAAKAGVIAFTKAAAIEYGTKGIRANAICPGFIETEMSGGPGAAERFPALVQGTALKRGGQPEEVAELAAFLALRSRAGYITGAVIPSRRWLDGTARRDDRERHRRLLRPVRRRHQRRSVPDVPAAQRRSADLLQRALRRLGAVAPCRRREGAGRLADLLQRPRRHPRDHPVGDGAPAGRRALRGPAAAHDAPRPDVACLHARGG